MLAKTEHDIVKVVEEKETARKEHKRLRAQRQAPEMPKITDYVQQKAEEYSLEASKRNWLRKVELADIGCVWGVCWCAATYAQLCAGVCVLNV